LIKKKKNLIHYIFIYFALRKSFRIVNVTRCVNFLVNIQVQVKCEQRICAMPVQPQHIAIEYLTMTYKYKKIG
jgi:hypothetical protein